eukprot:scaffold2274_cov343-Pavlova_lutheri.AAC.7
MSVALSLTGIPRCGTIPHRNHAVNTGAPAILRAMLSPYHHRSFCSSPVQARLSFTQCRMVLAAMAATFGSPDVSIVLENWLGNHTLQT